MGDNSADRLFAKQRKLRKGGGEDTEIDNNQEYFADLVKKPKSTGGGGSLQNKGGLNIAPFISTLAILGTRLLKDEKFMKNSNFRLLSSKPKSKSSKPKSSKSKSRSKMSGGDGDATSATQEPQLRADANMAPSMPKMSGMGESFVADSAKMSDADLKNLTEVINNNSQMTGGKKKRSSAKKTTKKSTKKTQKKRSK